MRVRVIVGDLKQRSLRPQVRTGEETRPAQTPDGEGPLFVVSGRAIFGAIDIVSR